MGKTPFPPYQERLLPPKIGAGMDRGATKRSGATWWHRMVGTLRGTDAYFRLEWVKASTHWGIGGSLDGADDGVIFQWVKMGDPLIPWASGPWRDPGYGDGAKYVDEFGVYGINAYGDSIEFSGMTDTPMTVLQWQKGIWLSAAIAHDGGLSSDEFLWNMHHREACQPSYKDCPFPAVYKHTDAYQRGIAATMAHYEGKRVEDHVAVAGLIIPLAFSQVAVPPTPVNPVFVSFPEPREALLKVGATLRQYGNTTAKIYEVIKSQRLEQFDGYYVGQMVNGSDRWYVTDNALHERVHSSGIIIPQDWG